MTDNIIKFPEPLVPTINDVFQPWVTKWGIDDCRALILALEKAGYGFYEVKKVEKLNDALGQYQKYSDVLVKSNDAYADGLKSLKETVQDWDQRDREIQERFEQRRMEIYEKYRNWKWWKLW